MVFQKVVPLLLGRGILQKGERTKKSDVSALATTSTRLSRVLHLRFRARRSGDLIDGVFSDGESTYRPRKAKRVPQQKNIDIRQ